MDDLIKIYHQRAQHETAGCCPALEELLDYSDETLAADRSGAIMDHLAYCCLCQDTVMTLKASPELRPALAAHDPESDRQQFMRRRSGKLRWTMGSVWDILARRPLWVTAGLAATLVIITT